MLMIGNLIKMVEDKINGWWNSKFDWNSDDNSIVF